MTKERAILLWRLSRTGLPPSAFGDYMPGNGWTNAKLEAILLKVEDRPPTEKQKQTFLSAFRKRMEKQL